MTLANTPVPSSAVGEVLLALLPVDHPEGGDHKPEPGIGKGGLSATVLLVCQICNLGASLSLWQTSSQVVLAGTLHGIMGKAEPKPLTETRAEMNLTSVISRSAVQDIPRVGLMLRQQGTGLAWQELGWSDCWIQN